MLISIENCLQNHGIDREINVLRTVMKYIAKYKLESEYPPEDLEKQIVKLEKQKVLINGTAQTGKLKANGKGKILVPFLACGGNS